MDDLLFLAHRIPYPPDKGDKIRSFNFLRHLSRHYRIRLGAFVDDPADWRHREALGELCEEVHLVGLSKRRALVRGLAGSLRGAPVTLPYFRDATMRRWVEGVRRGGVGRAFVFSSAMAQYLMPRGGAAPRQVLDFVDVDSDKWRQYAAYKPWPLSMLYRREARRLVAFEARAAREFDACLFVSEAEAGLFRESVPGLEQRIFAVENGVDAEFFSPERDYPCPFDAGGPVVVFTGAMDYWANVDAVNWFASEVFPPLLQRLPRARFFIVGSRPTEAVLALGRRAGVVVTGWVPDVRPYLAHARVAVAPLRIARGVQNKVLEAMAMARPVVASTQALDGLDFDGTTALRADTAARFAEETGAVLAGAVDEAMGRRAREWVRRRYGWEGKVERCRDLLETAGVEKTIP